MTENDVISQLKAIKPEQVRQMGKAFQFNAQIIGLTPLQATATVVALVLGSEDCPGSPDDIITLLKRYISTYESPDNPFLNPERN